MRGARDAIVHSGRSDLWDVAQLGLIDLPTEAYRGVAESTADCHPQGHFGGLELSDVDHPDVPRQPGPVHLDRESAETQKVPSPAHQRRAKEALVTDHHPRHRSDLG